MTPATPNLAEEEIHYPESDGKPMAESDYQRKPLAYLIEALEVYYEDEQDVYASGNMNLYYREGKPQFVVAPDVFVVFGIPKRERRVYQTWVEGKGPDLVIEILSETTWRNDLHDKPELYQKLGVNEYYLYDPLGTHLKPALRGFALAEGGPIPLDWAPGHDRRICSQLLDLHLCLTERGLRLYDPLKGDYLPTYDELTHACSRAETEVEAERKARERAEAGIRAERKARERAEAGIRAERKAREQAERRQVCAEKKIEDEHTARKQAEQKVKALEEMVSRLRSEPD